MQTALLVITLVATGILCLMLLLSRRSVLAEISLVLTLCAFAGALTLDWAILGAPEQAQSLARLSLTLSGTACLALVGFSLVFARTYDTARLPWAHIGILALLLALPLTAAVLPAASLLRQPQPGTPWLVPLTLTGFSLQVGMIAALILALYNLEATLVRATHANRWRIKFIVLGCMAVATSQVFSATPAILYLTLDLSLRPTREIGLLLGTALMGFSLVTRPGQVKVVFSQRLAYNSLVVLLSGIYFVAIGVLGQNVALRQSHAFSQIDVIMALVGGVLLTALLLSETARRKAAVTLRKYFYKDKYDYRQQWLSHTHRLAMANKSSALHQAVLLGFCETFGFSIAALYLRRPPNEFFDPVARLEIDLPTTPVHPDDPLCPDTNSRISVKDLRGQSLPLPVSFSIPLECNDTLAGFILLGRPFNTDEGYEEEDFELMEAMARQSFLAMHNLNLAEELALAKEMEIIGKISAFMLHDLKNLVYTLSLMVENAKHFIGEPEFQRDMVKSLDNTVARMKQLITQLKKLPSKGSLHCEDVNLLELVQESAKAVPGAQIVVTGGPASALIDRKEMSKVLVNLLRNAHEACNGGEAVDVEVGDSPHPYVKVRDSGLGMTEDFLQSSLFVPFATTKKHGLGIGLYQSRHIVEAHNGRIEVESSPGRGSTFTVLLPEGGLHHCHGTC